MGSEQQSRGCGRKEDDGDEESLGGRVGGGLSQACIMRPVRRLLPASWPARKRTDAKWRKIDGGKWKKSAEFQVTCIKGNGSYDAATDGWLQRGRPAAQILATAKCN